MVPQGHHGGRHSYQKPKQGESCVWSGMSGRVQGTGGREVKQTGW